MRTIMMLTRNFPPMMTEGAMRAYGFARALKESGWEPLVIGPEVPAGGIAVPRFSFTVRYAGEAGERKEMDDLGLFRALRREPVSGFDRLSQRLQPEQDGRRWEKHARRIAGECMKEHGDIAALYAQAPPYDAIRLALELSRKHGLPLLPDLLWPCGEGRCRKDEELLINAHHGLVVPARYAKETLLKRYLGRVGHGDISVVPGLSRCSGSGGAERVDNEGLQLLFLVGGGHPGRFEKVFTALFGGLLPLLMEGTRMMFAGTRSHEAARVAVKAGYNDAMVPPGRGTLENELGYCSRADLCCMVLTEPLPSTGYVPERFLDVISCGIPVIAALPPGYQCKDFVDAGGGRVNNNDPEAFREATVKQLEMLQGEGRKQNPRQAVDDDWSIQDTAILLRELMSRLPLA